MSGEQFPRGLNLPRQSPLFWVSEKDRYLRQLLIRDIMEMTGRCLLVYFALPDVQAQIGPGDDIYLIELLRDGKNGPVDLLIETPGGFTDATEKLASILRQLAPDLRVIVPCRAKSNGTMLALIGSKIVMGPGSELGPADPLITLGPNNSIPAHFILSSPPGSIDPIIVQAATHAVMQTKKLAFELLSTGMMTNKNKTDIDTTVEALSSRNTYKSHGSVIDPDEAIRLGLSVDKMDAANEIWQKMWLLRCMYDHDVRRAGAHKVFEGPSVSNTLRAP
jgi:Serine dehydrogenase proteinase